MKIAVIGDLHGKDCWKKLLEGRFSEFDKMIFMGDYSDDSWVRFCDEDIINNLRDVIEFKKNHSDNVELLIGNHDFQYIVGYPTASRYRESYAKEMNEIFNDNSNIFKPIHIENNYIFWRKGEYVITVTDMVGKTTSTTFTISSFDIVADPDGAATLGTEVTLNDGEKGGTTLHVGYTRCLYLDGNAPSQSRLDYTFTSSNSSVATVSEYGTVTAKGVGVVEITCVLKSNPSKVSKIILTI